VVAGNGGRGQGRGGGNIGGQFYAWDYLPLEQAFSLASNVAATL